MIISNDQWRVSGTCPNHRRTWSVTVRAQTREGAMRAGWQHQSRPSWASPHTVRAELATPANDEAVRWGMLVGLIREVKE